MHFSLSSATGRQIVRARRRGRVTASIGLLVEAHGLGAELGERAEIMTAHGPKSAEVVGFKGETSFLMPLDEMHGLQVDASVRLAMTLPVPDALSALGRILDASGSPIDGRGPLGQQKLATQSLARINPLVRPPIDEVLDVGVASINSLITIGKGQRVGLFAGSGVGKSVTLGMLARNTKADVVILAMIGERGREVREFIEDNLGGGLPHATVVVSPADDSPALRLRGAWLATELAEFHRHQGKDVLLLMDSLTRCAQAQREIGLALGEPPATKGYTPSVFALLPKLVERTGRTDSGSITAFYTVLMEEDDLQDPIVDAARAILDGHIVLSRRLADAGIYPAVDVGASVSRLQSRIVPEVERGLSQRFKALWSRYTEQEDLINMGAYQRGADPLTDEAIARRGKLVEFLKQPASARLTYAESIGRLRVLFGEAQSLIP